MLKPYESGDSKTVFATKAVNRVIDTIIDKNYDGDQPKNRCFITVIGYNHDVKKVASGFLKDLNSNPLRVDTIKKKISDGAGGLVEVDYKMPVWIEPITEDGATNMKGAFELAKTIIEQWIKDKPDNPAPILINISDGVPYYEGKFVKDCMNETIEVAKEIKNLSVADGNPLIFNAMIHKAGQKLEFPKSEAECSNDESKFLFEISSELPETYINLGHIKGLNVQEGSRGCIFEADEVQLINLIDFGSSKAQRDR
ncbi:MAG: hypothetical protein HDT09_01265 [Bacteroidales bacterium]|nr:hypothetical protein [Bacteroidales bacterium]